MDKRWGANTVLISKFFVSHCPNLSQGVQSRKLRVSKHFTHEKGISLFSVVFVLSDSAENFCTEHFSVSEIFKYRKLLWMGERLYHGLPLKVYCITRPKKLWGNTSMFQKKSIDKIFLLLWLVGWQGEVSRPSIEIILSHSAENFRGGNRLCFRKFQGSKNWWIRGGGDYHGFLFNFCWLRVPKFFSGKPFKVWENFRYHKTLGIRKRYHYFLLSFFVSQFENFCGGSLQCFTKLRGSKNLMHKQGISLFTVDFFCLTVPKNFVGETFCVSELFKYRKSLWIRGLGGYHGFLFQISGFKVLKMFSVKPFKI